MNEAEAEQGESLDDKLDAEQPDDPQDGTSFFPVADDNELDTDLSDVFTNEEEYDAENNQERAGQEE